MSEKCMTSLLSSNKFIDLKSIKLEFCEDYVHGKQKRVNFSKMGIRVKLKKLELIYSDV